LSVTLKNEASVSAQGLEIKLKEMIHRRHNLEQKFLDLSALGSDNEFASQGMFDTPERASRFFSTLMKVCARIWPKYSDRNAAVENISLANNGLPDIKCVLPLSQAFAKIRGLDLSGNQLDDLKSLRPWSRKFRNLEILILRGNNLENVLDFHLELLKWYPRLRQIDHVQVRTEDELAASKSRSASPTQPQTPPEPTATPAQLDIPAGLALPYEGFGLPRSDKSAELLQKELLALELSKHTRMTIEYSEMCLEEPLVNWNLHAAWEKYLMVFDNIPQDAFW
jgi:hypothetical protein